MSTDKRMPKRKAETKEQRSFVMSRVRSSGNASTELRFVAMLKTAGITGWRRNSSLVGRPDFVFRKARVVVFLDGCFWHKCPKCHRQPKANESYWLNKMARNVARDTKVTLTLAAAGWKVLRIWEHSLKQPENLVDGAINQLLACLKEG